MTKQYADNTQHIDLALKLFKQQVTPEDAISLCKSKSINDKQYFGITVANHMQLLYRLNEGARNGIVKCTKKSGLTF